MNPSDWDGDGVEQPLLTPSNNNEIHLGIDESSTQFLGSGYLNIDQSYPYFTYTAGSTTFTPGLTDSIITFRYGTTQIGQRPIEFDFSNSSWKSIMPLVMSIILSPILIMLSKLLKKPTGFRIR